MVACAKKSKSDEQKLTEEERQWAGLVVFIDSMKVIGLSAHLQLYFTLFFCFHKRALWLVLFCYYILGQCLVGHDGIELNV